MKAYVIEKNGTLVIGHDGTKFTDIPVNYKKSIGHSPAIKAISIEKEFALVFPSRTFAQEILDENKFENCKVARVSMDMGNILNLKSYKFSAEWIWDKMSTK